MKPTRKRTAAQAESQESAKKKLKSDSCSSSQEQVMQFLKQVLDLTTKAEELKVEKEEIQAAADRNSVKMGKVLRQNQEYLQKLEEMRTELDKERQEADKWRQKFMKLNQDFETYRQHKREEVTTIADRIKSRKDRNRKKNYQPIKLTRSQNSSGSNEESAQKFMKSFIDYY